MSGKNSGKISPYSPFKALHHTETLKGMLNGERVSPVYIRMKPTNRCNQSCYYCCYADSRFDGRHANRADFIPLEKMVEILDDLKTMGVKAITLSGGGEPLFYPYIDELLCKIIETGLEYSVITNGQALTGSIAEKLAGANWVRISLDSADSECYHKMRGVKTFDTVVNNIKNFSRIKNSDCNLGINTVVTKENAYKIHNICKLAYENGVDNIKFSPYLLYENSSDYHRDIKDSVIKQIEEARNDFEQKGLIITDKYSNDIYFDQQSHKTYKRCLIAEYFAVIAADCKVYICHQKSYIPEGELGDLSKQSFKSLWFSEETIRRVRELRTDMICKNVCAFEETNILLDSVLNVDKKSVNFI